MRVAVIGPLEVRTDVGVRLPVPGARERTLLAVLAAGAPDVVPVDRLVEALWPEDPPPSAREPLQLHLTALRHALEPGQPPGSSGQYVLRRGAGYVLATARGDVDALHLADLAARGRGQLARGDGPEAVRSLTAALALWRGEPYAEWPDASFAVAERRRLTAIRAAAETALQEARQLPVASARVGASATPVPQQPVHRPPPVVAGAGRPVVDRGTAPAATEGPADVPPSEAAAGPAAHALLAAPAVGRLRARRRTWLVVGGSVAALLVALATARLTVRAGEEAERARTVASANRLTELSQTAGPLDTAFLLAAQAFRLADTPQTRAGLRAVVRQHDSVERAVSFRGNPQDPVLSGGGRTLTFGVGTSVLGWSVSSSDVPHVLMDIPPDWGAWIVAAPSPVDDVVMGAGMGAHGPWLRRVSTLDGTSHLLQEGDRVGGRPVDGAVTADGSRLVLLVAEPAAEAPDEVTRWQLLDVDIADGTTRDTGIGGLTAVPIEGLRADFADDARSFVVWDHTDTAPAVLVDVAGARQALVDTPRPPVRTAGYRAFGAGAAQLWDDGSVTLLDRDGAPVQHLRLHGPQVLDLAVAPDGAWAVTVDDAGRVVRWDVDASTRRWVHPEALAGHTAGVAGVQVDAAGRTLVTVGRDRSIISWSVGSDGDVAAGSADPAAWLETACAVVARDLTPLEWRHYLPDLPWQPTCTDLG